MNRFSANTVVLLSCWLCAGKLSAEFPEVEKARLRGAQGQVTFCIVDSKGGAVRDAKISGAFFPSDSYAGAKAFEGYTDTNGLFVANGKTVEDTNYAVTKEGFYKTTGKYWFYRRGENCIRDGRWQPWNPTNTVVLKEHRNPIAMYAKRVDAPVPVRDTPVGFDLEIGDWVAPHGKGKQADMLFTDKAKVQDYWNGSLELIIACTNQLAGFCRMKKDMGSDFRSAYEAPNAGYQQDIQFAFVTTTDKDLKVDKLGDTEYIAFRVRTVVDDNGNIINARFGKIYGPIEFGVGKEHHVRFTYYLNPTTNDRNLEFDPDKNRFGKTKGERRVNMP